MEQEHLILEVSEWAKGLSVPVLVFLFGSYLKGTPEEASDIDLAVIPLTDMGIDERTEFWQSNRPKWEKKLTERLGKEVDLELYEPGISTNLREYLLESSRLIYAP